MSELVESTEAEAATSEAAESTPEAEATYSEVAQPSPTPVASRIVKAALMSGVIRPEATVEQLVTGVGDDVQQGDYVFAYSGYLFWVSGDKGPEPKDPDLESPNNDDIDITTR